LGNTTLLKIKGVSIGGKRDGERRKRGKKKQDGQSSEVLRSKKITEGREEGSAKMLKPGRTSSPEVGGKGKKRITKPLISKPVLDSGGKERKGHSNRCTEKNIYRQVL